MTNVVWVRVLDNVLALALGRVENVTAPEETGRVPTDPDPVPGALEVPFP